MNPVQKKFHSSPHNTNPAYIDVIPYNEVTVQQEKGSSPTRYCECVSISVTQQHNNRLKMLVQWYLWLPSYGL